MNPWANLLAQFAAQALAQEGPILIQELAGALNGALSQHGHTVTITPVVAAAGTAPDVSPAADPSAPVDTAARPASKSNPTA